MTLDHANGSPVLDESPPSPPSSLPPPATGLFGFGSLPEEETAAEGTPEGLDDHGSGSATDWPSDELDDLDESSTTSSPASSGSPLASKAQLKDTFRAGVRISTATAHRVAARTPGQQQVGLYLADDEDARAIGDPLAEIAHRRGGLGGGKLSPDANNALQAAMGLAGYFAKQMRGISLAREIDGQGTVVQPIPGGYDDGEVA